MSIEAFDRAFDFSRAKRGALLVILYLGFRTDEASGLAWPGIANLAKYCRLSKRQVRRNLSTLVKLGELRLNRNAGPHGTNTYKVMCHGHNWRTRGKSNQGEALGVRPDNMSTDKPSSVMPHTPAAEPAPRRWRATGDFQVPPE